MDLTIPVDDRTVARETRHYVTWEGLTDGWAILVIPELSLYIPGRHTTAFTTVPTSFPLGGERIERNTDFEFVAHAPHGRIDVFDTLASARRYAQRQAFKAKKAKRE